MFIERAAARMFPMFATGHGGRHASEESGCPAPIGGANLTKFTLPFASTRAGAKGEGAASRIRNGHRREFAPARARGRPRKGKCREKVTNVTRNGGGRRVLEGRAPAIGCWGHGLLLRVREKERGIYPIRRGVGKSPSAVRRMEWAKLQKDRQERAQWRGRRGERRLGARVRERPDPGRHHRQQSAARRAEHPGDGGDDFCRGRFRGRHAWRTSYCFPGIDRNRMRHPPRGVGSRGVFGLASPLCLGRLGK